MIVLEHLAETKHYCRQTQKEGCSIGFVPTMGCLHEGHLSLIRESVKHNDITVLSIFLNPTQFNSQKDLLHYPKPLERDLLLAEEAGADLVFTPSSHEMYPDGHVTYVDVRELSGPLCGVSRPGHFTGMATVVLKLFNLVRPDRAYFGQKDYQQLCIVKQMVSDLDLDVEIVSCPTVRERDGLAMSSRNLRLQKEDRKKATAIYSALKSAEKKARNGENCASSLASWIEKSISSHGLTIDYVEIADAGTLKSVKEIQGRILVAAAAEIGGVRLIDNIVLETDPVRC